MAMTTCEKCGASISDMAVTCPNCGEKLKHKTAVTWSKKRSRIFVGIMAIMVVAVILIITIIKNVNESKFDDDDKYVLECVEKLQKEKGNISLENDIKYSIQNKIFVFVEFNSSDGSEVAYFVDGVYIGTDKDNERLKKIDRYDVKNGKITDDEYSKVLEKKIAFAHADMELALWGARSIAGLGETDDRHLVSAKKIGKKLGISYPKN